MTRFAHLPTLAEMQAERSVKRERIAKGPSRLERVVDDTKADAKQERVWKRAIWIRDHGCCRWCKRKVQKCLALVPERGECHHVSGRVVKAIRWRRENGILLCAADHERLTGKIDEKFLLVSTKTFTVDGIAYANADYAVRFKRIA